MTPGAIIDMLHILSGTVTFFLGALQFIRYIRENFIAFHRLTGKCYILCVLLSSPTAFFISFRSPLILAAAGTAIQSALWLITTLFAWRSIMKKDIIKHSQWMLRSYALVLTAPLLRLCIVFLKYGAGIDYQANFNFYYPLFVWLGFLPLVLAEFYIYSRRTK
ncbi:MAG: DUF2306 domain-containing protein [Candidatus Omnitrophica bacterium]|nr:DUF2306 domain-containing protein [Candidatus Omnitrophota bacterium]MCB9719952.1 DUF2306 domain-containing protein [Candidatus Omnitrophota bacterium]